MAEKEERKICEGCRTGNYYLCNSFPGRAKKHVEREIQYRRAKARKLESMGKVPQNHYEEGVKA